MILFFKGLWTSILGNWTLYAAGAALGVAVFGTGFYMGTDYMKGKNAEAKLESAVEKIEKKDENQGIATKADTATTSKLGQTRKSAVLVEAQVHKYVKEPITAQEESAFKRSEFVNRKLPFDDMWICIHNRAATNNPTLDVEPCPKETK